MLDLRAAPIPLRWRTLWLPEAMTGQNLLSSVPGVGSLPVTGGMKGSTADGVGFTGVATSNINAGAIHNANAKLWVSFRFRPDWDHGVGTAIQYLFGKYVDANNYIRIWLSNVDGALYFENRTGAVTRFTIASAEVAWVSGTWYHVLASISDVNGARLRINGGAAVVNADLNAAPAGGDFVLGDFDDPGAGTGFRGTMADVAVGNDDLTAAEEVELSRGFWPADTRNLWLLDEGRGATATDRGVAGNNGALDADAYWKFGRCKQVAVSYDGINDGADGGAHRIDGNLTFLQVMKMKSTYNALAADRYLMMGGPSGTNFWELRYLTASDQFSLRWRAGNPNTDVELAIPTKPSIDDYWVVALPVQVGGNRQVYINGVLVASVAGTLGMFAGPSNMRDAWDSAANPDNHKTLLLGVLDTALSGAEIKALSRFISNQMGLGISV